MHAAAENLLPDASQISLAEELGIEVEQGISSESLVSGIDQELAEKSLEEQARWFVLSVLRHLTSAQWLEPSASDVDLSRQYSLAQECLAINGFKNSMTTVLKDRRCLYTLLSFGKVKNTKKNILSSATKAYKITADVLNRESLLQTSQSASEAQQGETSVEKPANEEQYSEALKEKPISEEQQVEALRDVPQGRKQDNTAANRRAGRRGYLAAALQPNIDTHKPENTTARKNQISSMSEKEFLDLQAAIESSTQEPEQQEWNYRSNEDRWSLILGLAAGLGFFSLILILFL